MGVLDVASSAKSLFIVLDVLFLLGEESSSLLMREAISSAEVGSGSGSDLQRVVLVRDN